MKIQARVAKKVSQLEGPAIIIIEPINEQKIGKKNVMIGPMEIIMPVDYAEDIPLGHIFQLELTWD